MAVIPVLPHPPRMLRWNFPPMPRFDAIFFDFDGVLIDSEPVHWACWREVLLPLGVSLEWEYYRDHCIGIDDREMLQTIAGDRDWHELWAEYPKKKQLFRSKMVDSPPFRRLSGPHWSVCKGSSSSLWSVRAPARRSSPIPT